MAKITKRIVDGLAPDTGGKDRFAWDGELRGFGVRVKPSGSKTYLIQYRTPEAQTRRLAIGKVGTLTPEEARKLARENLARVAAGQDPSSDRRSARDALTVGELADQYLSAARSGLVATRFRRAKKSSTVLFDEGRIERHVKPLLGRLPVSKLTRADVQRMADAIAQGKTAGVFKTKPRGKAVVSGGAGTAARVVGLLGGMWTWAEKRGLVIGVNPARGIETQIGQPKNRVLSKQELRALGQVLDACIPPNRLAAVAVRLIALTGLRRQEACGLRWDEIDELGCCLRLSDTKTGRATRPVAPVVLKLLSTLRSPENTSPWVFPSSDGTKPTDLKKRIAGLFEAAGLEDARSHDLRRTFASVAAELGYGEATISELLGHARRGVTERHYIRRPDAVLIAAASNVADRISADMSAVAQEGGVIELKAKQ